MAKLVFRSREERRAHMARRHLREGKPIPRTKKVKGLPWSSTHGVKYQRGFSTRAIHFVGNVFVRYPKAIAAGLIGLVAYFYFQQANGVTQWAGGLAMSTLAVANPELSVKIAQKTHKYMTYGVEKVGENLSQSTREGD